MTTSTAPLPAVTAAIVASDGEPVDLDGQPARTAPWCSCSGGRFSAEWATWTDGDITGYCCRYCRRPTGKTIPPAVTPPPADVAVTVTPRQLAAAWWNREGDRYTWPELPEGVQDGYVAAAADWLAACLNPTPADRVTPTP